MKSVLWQQSIIEESNCHPKERDQNKTRFFLPVKNDGGYCIQAEHRHCRVVQWFIQRTAVHRLYHIATVVPAQLKSSWDTELILSTFKIVHNYADIK